MPVQNLKLAQIEIADLQARAGTDDKTIDEYAEAWQDGQKFPPVVTFHDGNRYFLADGFHRYFGAKKAGLLDIPAEVHSGSRKDALWYAAGANRTHGLKRSNADKRRAVELALREKPELSDRAIAEHVGVGHPLVADVRSQVEEIPPAVQSIPRRQVEEIPPEVVESLGKSQKIPPPPPERRVGLDGKKYPVPPPPPPRFSVPEAPLPPVEAVVVRDETGLPIPEGLLPLWHRTPEAQQLLTELSRIRGALRQAQESKDLLFAEVSYSTALAAADQLYASLKTAIPYAVCTSCQGKTKDQCVLCHKRGFISQFKWDTCVPKETKAIRAKAQK